jgi:Cu2+-exporting ATPase
MADLVAVAESAKTRYTTLAERAASWYSPLVHILSFSAFGFWMWKTGGDLRFAVNISAAVLIITCPCALGLAVPAVVTSASGKLFRKGLLIKHGTALERLAQVDTVVFDKTGTLTMGAPEVTNLADHPRGGRGGAGAGRRLVAPAGAALAEAARAAGIHPAGRATCAKCRAMASRAVARPDACGLAAPNGAVRRGGRTATYLCTGEGERRAPSPSPTACAPAPKPVPALMAQGKRVIRLISGDTEPAVAALATAAGHRRLDLGRAAGRKGAAWWRDLTAGGAGC